MTDVVLDASALVFGLTSEAPSASVLRQRFAHLDCHAPHHIDAEVGNVLRRKERRGELDSQAALTALRAGRHMVDQRYPHAGPLAESAWRLRESITFYDALYVALAMNLGASLITADKRLAAAPTLSCEVEVVG